MATPLDIWSAWQRGDMLRNAPAGPPRTSTPSATEAALRALADNPLLPPIPYRRPVPVPPMDRLGSQSLLPYLPDGTPGIPSAPRSMASLASSFSPGYLPYSPAPLEWGSATNLPAYEPEFFKQPIATPAINTWMYDRANPPAAAPTATMGTYPERQPSTIPRGMIDALQKRPVPTAMTEALQKRVTPQAMLNSYSDPSTIPSSMLDALNNPSLRYSEAEGSWRDTPQDRDFSETEGSWYDNPASTGTSYQPVQPQSVAALAAAQYTPSFGGSNMPAQWRDPATGRRTLGYAPELPLNPNRSNITQDYINMANRRDAELAAQRLSDAITGGASPARINQLALLTRSAADPNGAMNGAPAASPSRRPLSIRELLGYGGGGGGNVRSVSLPTHMNSIPNVPALVKGAPGSGWTSKNIEGGGIGAGPLNKLVRDPTNKDIVPERAAALSNAYLNPSNWEWRERTGGGGDFVPVTNSMYKDAAARMTAAANPSGRFSNVVVGPTPSGAYEAFANLQKFREQMRQAAILNDRAERIFASDLDEKAKNRELTALDMALKREAQANQMARESNDTAFSRERALNAEGLRRGELTSKEDDAATKLRLYNEQGIRDTDYTRMLGDLYQEGAKITDDKNTLQSKVVEAAQTIALDPKYKNKFSMKFMPGSDDPYFDGAQGLANQTLMLEASNRLRTSPEWQAAMAHRNTIANFNARLSAVQDAQKLGVDPSTVGRWTNTNLFPRLPGSGASTNAPRSSTNAPSAKKR